MKFDALKINPRKSPSPPSETRRPPPQPPLRQRRNPRPQDEVRQLLAHHLGHLHDGGGGPGVDVHDRGEVADDEVDPGAAITARRRNAPGAHRDMAAWLSIEASPPRRSAPGAAPPSPGTKTPGR